MSKCKIPFLGLVGLLSLVLPLRVCAQWRMKADSSLVEAKTHVRYASTSQNADRVLKVSLFEPGKLPPDLERLKGLRLLEVYAPDRMLTFQQLPDGLWKLQNLQYLRLSETSLDSLPPQISQLTALRVLQLPNNPLLKELPAAIGFLPNLEELDAGQSALPNNLARAPRLRLLHTNAERLPLLPHLETLFYGGVRLPDAVLALPNLRAVHLSAAAWPVHLSMKTLMNLPTLEELSFDATRADRYAWEHVSRMIGLRKLTVRHVKYLTEDIQNLNQLTEIAILQTPCATPGSCGPVFGPLAPLPRLEALTVNHLGDNLDTLKQLRTLRLIDCPDLKSGDFKRLSAQLRRLPKLEKLDLRGSDLSGARNVSFDSLATLRSLDLTDTRLPYSEAVWKSLRGLQTLRSLALSADELGVAQCAEELAGMSQLRELTILTREGERRQVLSPDCEERVRKALPKCKVVFLR